MSGQRPAAGPVRQFSFPEFEDSNLSNGMRLLAAPMRKLPLVTLTAVLDAGSMHDPAGLEGLARMTAKSLMEGTSRRGASDFVESIERLGIVAEASANWDATAVTMTFMADRLVEAAALLGEILLSPVFPEGEVDRLKTERLADLVQIDSEPRELADQSFENSLFNPDSRYSGPAGGTAESVRRIGAGDVLGFYRDNYAPSSSAIIIAGDLPDTFGADIEAALGGWNAPGRRKTVVRAEERTQAAEPAVIEKHGAPQSEIRVGHLGPSRNDPDFFSISVMNAILGGLFGSRINLNLREKHGYTYGASSTFDWRKSRAPFVIATAVQSEVTAKALREIHSEIRRIRAEEPNPDELSLAKDYMEGVFPIRFETTGAVASALSNMVIHDLPSDYYRSYRSKVHAVTATDVLNAARKHIDPDRMRTLVLGDPELISAQMDDIRAAATKSE